MKLIRLTFRNILSYGNIDTVIDFDNETQLKTIGVVGDNGTGKSAIFDAIFFALFNKPYRKLTSKSKLINKYNRKDLYVKLEFESNGHIYIIERGMESAKKSYINITKDDEEQILDAHSNDIQKVIETQILGINENIFRLIFMIGLGVFTSFFEKSLPDRRVIFEFILGINVLSVMLETIKKSNRVDTKKLNDLKRSLDEQKNLKVVYKEKLEDVNKLTNNDYTQDINDLKKTIEKITKDLEEINYDEISKKSDNITKDIKKITQDINKYKKDLQENSILKSQDKKLLDFFLNNSICPTCTQKISEELRKNKEVELDKNIKEMEKKDKKLTDSVKELEKEEELKETDKTELREKLRELENLKAKKSDNENSLKKYEKKQAEVTQDVNTIISDINTKLENIQTKIKEVKKEGKKVTNNVIINEIFIEILGDTGIKKYVYNIILKQINKYINKMMVSFNFNYKVKLDSNLKEFFYEKIGEESDYQNFSNAEKLISNLSFIFGVLRFIEEFYGFTSNTLFFDEILDTSLDKKNKASLLELLQMVDKNIVIISHDQDLSSIFDVCYMVSCPGKFSEIECYGK